LEAGGMQKQNETLLDKEIATKKAPDKKEKEEGAGTQNKKKLTEQNRLYTRVPSEKLDRNRS